jgi:uncharacterized protein YneF (UPF0154 family)
MRHTNCIKFSLISVLIIILAISAGTFIGVTLADINNSKYMKKNIDDIESTMRYMEIMIGNYRKMF